MPDRSQKLPITIRPADANDLDNCFALEKLISEDNPDAGRIGFLLSGEDRTQYELYFAAGCFYVAELDSKVVGFLFALPPGNDRIARLLSAREKFSLNNPKVFNLSDLAWLAKVAVSPEFMRRGIASDLYRTLLSTYNHWNFLTTTVAEPICNRPSEELQMKFRFENIGQLSIGDRGKLKNIICKVYLRSANSKLP